MKRPKKKIAIIVSSLGRGGAQKASANLSILMHQLNCDVHIISLLNKIDFVYAERFRQQNLNNPHEHFAQTD